jgi:hypothetical protein
MKIKSFILKVLLLFLLFPAIVYSQTGAHLIPRRIFIGDFAVLILPLPAADQNKADIVLSELSPDFPSHPNIDFHKIILEQRIGGSRLIVEFTAFVPGLLEFPAIEIGENRFTGLSVTVNSILDSRSSLVLSGPASSLAMPGTAFMIYGSLVFIVFSILVTVWFIFKGRAFIAKFTEKWNRRKLFGLMRKLEKRLHKEILRGDDKRIILDILSDEFRTFLSYITGCNCRSMTANEFEDLPRICTMAEVRMHLITQEDRPSFLNTFFRTCDDLRFSGINITSETLIQLLDDMKNFLDILENTKENEQKEGES